MNFGPLLASAAAMVDVPHNHVSAQEASQRAQQAIVSASEGRTADAISGNIFVTNATFANLLKQHQDQIASLCEQLVAERLKKSELNEKLSTKQRRLKRAAKQLVKQDRDLSSRKYFRVIFHQADYRTRVYVVP